ncbi:hypothetical protein ElyMa_003274400 [Elysia marginata]|uniref:Uncharacterized protein n=1 Tax=Elysia marginata TaxID=1093978 RepID=A0AAV4JAQ3_9GAST|nr:hypothetical protein ElyMa_003274400 [Elysia marginata]
MMIKTLSSLRTDENFFILWVKVTSQTPVVGVGELALSDRRERRLVFSQRRPLCSSSVLAGNAWELIQANLVSTVEYTRLTSETFLVTVHTGTQVSLGASRYINTVIEYRHGFSR